MKKTPAGMAGAVGSSGWARTLRVVRLSLGAVITQRAPSLFGVLKEDGPIDPGRVDAAAWRIDARGGRAAIGL